MSKVILVLSDGLRYDIVAASMGYLSHLVEAKLASLYKVTGELPSRGHSGTTPDVREVPLYFIKPGLVGIGDTHEAVS